MSLQRWLSVSAQLLWLTVVIVYHSIVALLFFCVPTFIRPKKDVSGEIVLITGGGCGFGRLFALNFAKRGATVVLWDINERGAKDVAGECQTLGGRAFAYRVDVSHNESVYEAAAEVRRDVGDVSVLINNAGVAHGQTLFETEDRLLHQTIDVNVKSAFWLYKAFVPSMLTKNHGHIVNMSSSAGFAGAPNLADYCSSKYALCGLEEAMFYEMELYKNTGVHSTIIHPYFMNTGMFEGTKPGVPEILPLIDPEYAMRRCMDAILTNQRFVYIPDLLLRIVQFAKTLIPDKALTATYLFLGIDTQMQTYVGRQKKA